MLGMQFSCIQSLPGIRKILSFIIPSGRKRKNSSNKTETDKFQSQVLWCLPIISGFGRLRQEHWRVFSSTSWASEWVPGQLELPNDFGLIKTNAKEISIIFLSHEQNKNLKGVCVGKYDRRKLWEDEISRQRRR